MSKLRRARIVSRRYLTGLWRNFRHGLNVSWLALRDPAIGFGPKALGVAASLVGVAPIEWIPNIPPLIALSSDLILIPALLALAWWMVPRPIKDRLHEEARGRPVPMGFLALIASIATLAFAVDSYMDWTYPGDDAVSQAIDPYLERFEE